MHHRLLIILSRFDIATWKRCRLFVQMEISGKRPLEIYDYLMKTRKNHKKWDLEEVHEATLPILSKKAFQNELSRLTLAIESFISYEEFKQEKQYKDLLLRQYYLRYSDEKEWEQSFHKSIGRYNKQESISFFDQFDLIKILHQAYFGTHPIKKQYVIDILEQLYSSSESTLSAYGGYIKLILDHEKRITKNPQKELAIRDRVALDEVLFNKIEKLIKTYNTALLEDILRQVNEIESTSLESKIIIYGFLRAKLFKQIGKNPQTVPKQLMLRVIYKELEYMREAQIPVTPRRVYSTMTYLNYIEDIDKMKAIVERYSTQMSGSTLFELARTILMLATNRTPDAINHLNTIEVDSFKAKQSVRNLLVRAYSQYYDEVDFCLNEIKNFKIWLRSNKAKVSESSSKGILRSMDILVDMLKKKTPDKILAKIYQDEPLSGRMWLLKEVEKRYQIDTSLL